MGLVTRGAISAPLRVRQSGTGDHRRIQHSASVQVVDLNDVDLAIAASEAGAAVLRAKYGTPLTRIEKSPVDLAADADVQAEQAILEVLRSARPADRLIGEESGTARSGWTERSWLVDPMCGTLNYAAETPLVAVNVALRAGTEITAAVSTDPFTGEVMWTDGTRA
jgi:myo-inositol-1(or 4)-monophosphatase